MSDSYTPQLGDRVEYKNSGYNRWLPGTITGTGDFDDGRPIFDVRLDQGASVGGRPVMGLDRWGHAGQFRPLVDPLMAPPPARFPDAVIPPASVTEPWGRLRGRDVNADSGPASDWRDVILGAADRATGCFRGLAPRGHSLEPFAVLFTEGWWIKVDSNGRVVYFDAWTGSDRFVFWMNASSVQDLLARIDLEVRE